ncbi:squalene--hopene cyclase [Streptomyces sp. NPDC023838]|uniref:squalene--hopene cyclase n=1 Tax=Streptomyces sp. NPDC023838 TaxID=3154325 RepID=UPI0033EDD446
MEKLFETVSPTRVVARATLTRACDHLLGLQSPEGWWKGEFQTNVTMDAEDLLLREFLGIRTPEETEASARWIRSQQRPDGTWSTFHEGPPDLSTTVEAYLALRLAGDPAGAPHMTAAAGYVRDAGGVEESRFFTRFLLTLFGLGSWDDLPVLPPELIWLPAWFPLNIYDWASWARSTIVPLTVVGSRRPCHRLPFDLAELHRGTRQHRPRSVFSWVGFFEALDRALRRYDRRPLARLRKASVARCIDWILARQNRDGSWAGLQPPTFYSMIALRLLGQGLDHPAIQSGVRGLNAFTIWESTPDGPVRRVEACQSPVWDTVLATVALADAGLAPDHPALLKAADWVLGKQILGPGDWQVRRPHVEPGGWAFEFDNDPYPDMDDTATAVIALHRVHQRPESQQRVEQAIGSAISWLTGMQSRNGGWGAFDADNTQELCYRIPAFDFGSVIDPPSADVTAHVLEALCCVGHAETPSVRRGVSWLLNEQKPDGSWSGIWGVNHLYGTCAAVVALVAAGFTPDAPPVRRAVEWFEAHQAEDGGWGEDPRSYVDPSWVGRGTSTASQTAWALMGMLAAAPDSPAVDRGVRWLVERQRPDGTWDEPQFTGTGFPGDFYMNYHLYRLNYPITALGRYLTARGDR